MTPENGIFVCYRHKDSNHATHAIARRLRDAFGEKAVFWDHHDFHVGDDWSEKSEKLIPETKAVVVVLAKDWFSIGKERFQNPDDPVLGELKLATNSDCKIFPVTVDDTKWPTTEEVEQLRHELSGGDVDLASLFENFFSKVALPIRFTKDFESDIQELIGKLNELPDVYSIGTATSSNVGGLRVVRPWSILPRNRPQHLQEQPVDGEGPSGRASDLWILQAKHRAIPLIGRDQDMKSLMEWLENNQPVSARLIVGRAGAGKTRLGFDFLWNVFAEKSEKWEAGLIRPDSLRIFGDWNDWEWTKPTVLMLDYAVSVAEPVRKWFGALAHKAIDQNLPPLRILLVEREASSEEGWFNDLLEVENSAGGESVAMLFEPPEPVAMATLDSAGLRRELLRKTLQVTHEFTGAPLVYLPDEGTSETFDQRLEDDQWKDPLYLMMAALVAASSNQLANEDAQGEPKDGSESENLMASLKLGRVDLAREVAKHEKQRLETFVKTDEDSQKRFLVHMAMMATFCNGLDAESAKDSVAIESEELSLDWLGGGNNDLVRVLQTAFPADDFEVAAIEPDIVAESFVIETISKSGLSTSQQLAFVERAANRNVEAVANLLFHSFQNFANDEKTAKLLLKWIGGLADSALNVHPEWLIAIEGVLPSSSVELRTLSANVTKSLFDAAKQETFESPTKQYDLARLANNLAIRLGAVGLREEALETAREAVQIRRELTERNRDASLPGLASSINNLGIRLSEVGLREEALETAREAVKLYGELTERNRDAFLPHLASSFNNLGNRLSDVGLREEALETAREAVKLYGELTERNRDAFLPHLASSFNNLGNRLSDVGLREEALKAAKESVQIRRELTERNRDAFLPALATATNNSANRLSDVGLSEEALEAAKEAVQLFRELTARNRDAFLPDLATSLGARGVIHRTKRMNEEAMASFREGVELLAPKFLELPQAYAQLIAKLISEYLETAEAVGEQTDMEWLLPVLAKLEELRNEGV